MSAPVRYVAKKAMFNFLGNTFRMYDGNGGLRYYIKQKALKLKEDLRVYSDSSKSELKLRIQARNWADARGVFDFRTSADGAPFGGAKRNMFKSMLLDEWDLYDENDALIGKLKECGSWLSWVRKLIKWIPQTYQLTIEDEQVGTIRQRFNPFQLTYDIEFDPKIDERIVVATTVLMLAVESKYD